MYLNFFATYLATRTEATAANVYRFQYTLNLHARGAILFGARVDLRHGDATPDNSTVYAQIRPLSCKFVSAMAADTGQGLEEVNGSEMSFHHERPDSRAYRQRHATNETTLTADLFPDPPRGKLLLLRDLMRG